MVFFPKLTDDSYDGWFNLRTNRNDHLWLKYAWLYIFGIQLKEQVFKLFIAEMGKSDVFPSQVESMQI